MESELVAEASCRAEISEFRSQVHYELCDQGQVTWLLSVSVYTLSGKFSEQMYAFETSLEQCL